MRWMLRGLVGVALLVAFGAAIVAVMGDRAAAPLADRFVGPAIERALIRAGVERPAVEVTSLTSGGAAARLRAADGALTARLRVTFEPATVWRERRVETVIVERARSTLTVGAGGDVALRGYAPPPERAEDGGPLALPFGALLIEDLAVAIETPAGDGALSAAGSFSPEVGGRLRLRGRTAGPAMVAGAASTLGGEAVVTMSADGAIALAGAASGETTGAGPARRATLRAEGSASSWRDLIEGRTDALSGTGSLRTTDLLWTLPADTALRPFLTTAPEGAIPVGVDAALTVTASPGRIVVAAPPGAAAGLTARAPDATYEVRGGAPLLFVEDGGLRLDLDALAAGPLIAGRLEASAARTADRPWSVATSAELGHLRLLGFDLSALDLEADGVVTDEAASFGGVAAATLASAEVGVLVEDAPFDAPFLATFSRETGALTVTLPEGACAAASRVRLTMPGGAAISRARGLTVCAGDGPLLRREGQALTLDAAITAEAAPVAVGETTIGLTGPRIELGLRVDEAGAVVEADVEGAGSSLPGGLLAEGLAGTVRIEPDGPEDVQLTATLTRARLRQDAEAPAIAPLSVTGDLTLRGEMVRFAGEVATAKGRTIGAARGRHGIETGAGSATLRTADLTFAPGGLQPAALLPVLSGIVGRATGTLDATLTAGWGPEGVTSGGVVALDDLSFQGPGVAIARTAGLTGTVTLDSLAPVRTAGAQRLAVGLIDLRAIRLAGGEALFSLPGDDTVVVEEAVFPWLGGEVGVYETAVGFGGGGRAVLRGEDLEIGEALGILDVSGLSGEGQVAARLPLTLDAFSVRIDDGRFTSTRPGVIRYQGEATAAVADRNDQAKLAFGVLEDLRYDELSGTVDGPLAGSLQFGFTIEGTSELELPDKRVRGPVVAPVIYRLNIEAPLLQLIDQARLSTDARRQIERGMIEGRRETDAEREGGQD